MPGERAPGWADRARAAADEDNVHLLVGALVTLLEQERHRVDELAVRRLARAYQRSGLPLGWLL